MCAYAPGVQSRGGEFIAQGIMQAAQGFTQGLQQYAQRKEEKKKTEAGIAMVQNLAKTNPQLAKSLGITDPADTAAIKSGIKAVGGPDQFLNFAHGAQQMLAQQQQMQAQQKQQQQMEQEMARQEGFRSKLQQLSQVQRGIGTGVLRPEELQRMQGMLQNPVMRDSAALYGATGQAPSTGQLAQLMAVDRSRPAPQPQDAMEVVKLREADEQGRPIEVSYDKRTGKEIARGPLTEAPRPVLSPEEEARKVEIVGRTQGALKFNDEVVALGTEATRLSNRYERALKLLDVTYTGPGADFAASAKRWASLLGVDASSVANYEELQTILGDAIMQRVNQTKGAISDREMRLFELWSASPNKTPTGNKAILNAAKGVVEREREMSRLVQKLRREGKSELEIQDAVSDFATKAVEKPLFSEEDEKLFAPAAAAPAAKLPAGWSIRE